MPNTCVFCKAAETSREHVVGEWVGKLFPEEQQSTYGIMRANGDIISFQRKPFDLKVKVVCVNCNTGWMSDLETAVMSRLGPMIQSARATRLTPCFQSTLATWAVKTALMMEYLHPAPRVIPDTEYAALYAQQQPSQRYLVFISRWDPQIDTSSRALVIGHSNLVNKLPINTYPSRASREEAERLRKGFRDGTYIVFDSKFAIGHVAFAILGHNAPATLHLGMSLRFLEFGHRIWPVNHSLTWPPKRILGENTGTLEEFLAESDGKTEQEPTP